MTTEEKRMALASLFRELPEILTPIQIARAIHQSKNLVYEKLKEKELPGYIVHGRYGQCSLLSSEKVITIILYQFFGIGIKRKENSSFWP